MEIVRRTRDITELDSGLRARSNWRMIPTLLMTLLGVTGADPGKSAADDIRPIFAKHCASCHGSDKQKGGLRLDRKAEALRGGDSGASIVPGKPDASLLLKKLTSHDATEQMPPDGDRLTAEQVKAISDWVAAGAVWPEAATAEVPHWSFQPVKRPAVPGKDANPIDSLVRAKLTDNKLSPNPLADRRTLIRRLKFDLLGLPPTPEEVEAFAADKSPNAYEKLVDQYLASPQYGERWARHWLDTVRFAESHGFEMNQPRPTAWRYRDWVIASLNADKPYDRFAFEQLAGDTVGADAGTGFLVAGAMDGVKSPDPVLTANQRADELHDMVATTGSAFLGLTVGCARCHAHKFDPISQVDYYGFKAVLAGVQHGERPMKAGDAVGKAKELQTARNTLAALEAQLAEFEPLAEPEAKTERRDPVNPAQNRERFKPVKAKFVRFTVLGTNNLEACIDELEVFTAGPKPKNVALASGGAKATSDGDYSQAPALHRLAHLIDGQYGNGRSWISNRVGRGTVTVELPEAASIDRIVWGRDREGKYLDRTPTRYRIEVSLDGEAWQAVASSDDRLPFGSKANVIPSGLADTERKRWQKLTADIATTRTAVAGTMASDMAYIGRFGTSETIHRLHRGDPMAPKEVVGPGVISEIGPKLAIPEKASEPERRAALAKWIVDQANPLAARVIVNRLWQHHFGRGLVETPSDFGRNGGKPSHPALLDWLAAELVKPSGDAKHWAMKTLHRLMVTSETYKQSSASTREGLAKDAQSKLLWRYPPSRLDAEAIRDSVLFVSGKLDLAAAGGPGFDLFEPNGNYVRVFTPKKAFGPAEFRRMIYQTKHRMQLDDTFGAFDCPDGGQITPKRNTSTTPLQSLNLLNAPFLVEQSKFFSDRAAADAGRAPDAQVRRVFAVAFQRSPSAKELDRALKLVKEHGLPALCRAVLNANEFLMVE